MRCRCRSAPGRSPGTLRPPARPARGAQRQEKPSDHGEKPLGRAPERCRDSTGHISSAVAIPKTESSPPPPQRCRRFRAASHTRPQPKRAHVAPCPDSPAAPRPSPSGLRERRFRALSAPGRGSPRSAAPGRPRRAVRPEKVRRAAAPARSGLGSPGAPPAAPRAPGSVPVPSELGAGGDRGRSATEPPGRGSAGRLQEAPAIHGEAQTQPDCHHPADKRPDPRRQGGSDSWLITAESKEQARGRISPAFRARRSNPLITVTGLAHALALNTGD
ncbi:uncharacterized protein [Anser cygnoides]|uniref:uncharacterized protein n=1 Tax=Anser cygnoides TaxID=8845 RepID=UPI0034D3197E